MNSLTRRWKAFKTFEDTWRVGRLTPDGEDMELQERVYTAQAYATRRANRLNKEMREKLTAKIIAVCAVSRRDDSHEQMGR